MVTSTAYVVALVLGAGIFNHLDCSVAHIPFRFHICTEAPRGDRRIVVVVKDSFNSI